MNQIQTGSTIFSESYFQSHLEPPPFPLFDIHVNVGVTDTTGLSYGRLTPEHYWPLMEASYTAYACAFAPLQEEYDSANQAILEWSQTANGRIFPFARLGGNLIQPLQERWQLRKSLRDILTKRQTCETPLEPYSGVKLIPHLSGMPNQEMLSAIARQQLPVMIHTGVHCPPSWIEQHLLPKLTGPVILAHLGAFPCSPSDLEAAVAMAETYEQVYLDTSGVWLAVFMQYAVERIPEKLLFGSDTPLMHPLTAWYHLASVVKNSTDLEAISCRNAQTIFQPGDT